VVLDRVTCHYGSATVVDRMNLEIRSGEFFTLLGPSGCGKTTTLRTIAGFVSPSEGTVSIGDHDLTYAPPAQRPTNFVFQSYALFPHMTVTQNVEYGLRRAKVAKAEIRTRVQTELQRVGMADFSDRRPAQLSGGQQQRVALARALANRPKVLLLDEPLAALDYQLRVHLRSEMQAIHRDLGITFIFVTHDQEEALEMSDRVAVMDAGRLAQVATPEELYRRPINRTVARFIGNPNILDGSVVTSDSTATVVRLDVGLTVQCAPSAVAADSRCAVVLRPEDLTVDEALQPGAAALPGVVRAVAYSGAVYHLTVEAAGHILACQMPGHLAQRQLDSLRPGATVSVAPLRGDNHLIAH
jgi:spermidine/putrescine ABC transporter ATP-binding subunit